MVSIEKAHSQVSLLSQVTLLISKNWLPLEEAVPPGAGSPQNVKTSKTQIQNRIMQLTQLLRHPWSDSGLLLLPNEPGCMKPLPVHAGDLPDLLYHLSLESQFLDLNVLSLNQPSSPFFLLCRVVKNLVTSPWQVLLCSRVLISQVQVPPCFSTYTHFCPQPATPQSQLRQYTL